MELSDLERLALSVITHNPRLNNKELAQKMFIDNDEISYLVRSLGQKKLIEGSNKEGYITTRQGVIIIKEIRSKDVKKC